MGRRDSAGRRSDFYPVERIRQVGRGYAEKNADECKNKHELGKAETISHACKLGSARGRLAPFLCLQAQQHASL